MGICGSCGMNVNGEPRLTCATFLSDYAPGPVRVEPLANFPVVRDLVVDIDDFMEKLPRVKPWIIRDEEQSVDEGEYLQTPEELDAYKQFSMCINCMLCYAACPVYGLDPDFVGPAAIALAERYDLDSRDQGARERLDVLIEHEGVWGCTFVGECTRVCPKHVDPAGAIQRYKLKAAQESVKAFLLPRALRDDPPAAERHLAYRRPIPVLWWLRKRSYFVFVMRELSSIFVAWLVLYLLLFVRAVGRGEAAYATSSTGRPRPWLVALNVVAFAFVVLHTVTWFSLTPQAMVVRRRGRRVPAAAIIGAQYAGLAVVSGVRVLAGDADEAPGRALPVAGVQRGRRGGRDVPAGAGVPLRAGLPAGLDRPAGLRPPRGRRRHTRSRSWRCSGCS